MYYMAYGSNMSVEQMMNRCPDARLVGKGLLKGYKLVFRTHATIEKQKSSSVPVLIWDISKQDEKRLDRYEGFPKYYTKQNLNVRMTTLDGKKPRNITAMVYIMAKGFERNMPSLDYYSIIAEAYYNFGFDEAPLLEAMSETVEYRRRYL